MSDKRPKDLVCVMFGPPPWLGMDRQFCLSDMDGGLPCPTCCVTQYTSMQYPTRGAGYFENKRIAYLCPHCDAMICGRCCGNIMHHPELQNAQCKWCCKRVHPIRQLVLSEEEQQLQSFQCYFQADENIRNTLRYWQHAMSKRYGYTYDRSQIYWMDIMRLMGWRFFVDFDFTLIEQHPNQWGMLISMMIKNASAKGYSSQLVVHPSCSRFLRMNPDNQFVYMQTRSFVYMHNFSLVLTSALIKKCHRYSVTMRRYLLSNFAKILLQTLGICRMDDKPKKRN